MTKYRQLDAGYENMLRATLETFKQLSREQDETAKPTTGEQKQQRKTIPAQRRNNKAGKRRTAAKSRRI